MLPFHVYLMIFMKQGRANFFCRTSGILFGQLYATNDTQYLQDHWLHIDPAAGIVYSIRQLLELRISFVDTFACPDGVPV